MLKKEGTMNCIQCSRLKVCMKILVAPDHQNPPPRWIPWEYKKLAVSKTRLLYVGHNYDFLAT